MVRSVYGMSLLITPIKVLTQVQYTNESHTDGCNLYVKPRLPLVSTRGIACPFGDNICKLENDNLIMDTGLLDSLNDLGINSVPQHRFQFRMVYTCAPLKTQGYMTNYNDSDYGAVKRYMYGPVANVRQVNNYTYELPVDFAYLPGDNTSSANIPRLEYQLGMEYYYAKPNDTLIPGVADWAPIDALKLSDADVHILFVSAPEIHYSGPVTDPWFSAQRDASELNHQETETQYEAWIQDEPVGAMACTQQVQYCNPHIINGEHCEPLRGISDPRASDNVKKLFPDEDHFATIKWADSLWTFGVYTISATVGFIGASALRARYGLSYGYSAALPDNQWQLEAEHWIKGALASLQDVFVEASNGIPEVLEDFRQPPLDTEIVAKNLCVNQKIMSTNYSSFNVLGLSLILSLGLVIIALDMGLEPTVAWWQRRKYAKHLQRNETCDQDQISHPLYGALEWSNTNILQLQRMAQEEAGYGEWSGCDRDVPVTNSGQLLAPLDLRNIGHPQLRLKKPQSTPDSWNEPIISSKPWHVRRSDTGMETLIEETRAEKEGKNSLEDVHDMNAILENANNGNGGLGLNVQPDDGQERIDVDRDWRVLQ